MKLMPTCRIALRIWLTAWPVTLPAASHAQQIAIGEYPTPVVTIPQSITTGPDGALWFAGNGGMGRLTTAAAITQYALPGNDGSPFGIVAGPDGALWFAKQGDANHPDAIGRITTAGAITEYPTQGGPVGITSGGDGALWFTLESGNAVGRITTAGAITQYPLPTASTLPQSITAGPDGALSQKSLVAR